MHGHMILHFSLVVLAHGVSRGDMRQPKLTLLFPCVAAGDARKKEGRRAYQGTPRLTPWAVSKYIESRPLKVPDELGRSMVGNANIRHGCRLMIQMCSELPPHVAHFHEH